MLSKSGRHSEKTKTRPQQEPTIIINNYTQSNSPRRSYRSVLHGNSEENVGSSPPNRMSLKSSPVPSDSDPDADIDAYINWHIHKTPKHEYFLNDAKEKLLTEGTTLKTLRKMNNQDFKSIDIPLGIGMRLSEEVKDYKQGKK